MLSNKTLSLALVSLLATLALSAKIDNTAKDANGNAYSTKYDDVDLEEILHSERLLKNYVNCLLEKGRCTADALELKMNLPDAINNDCSKCSDKQRIGSETVMHYLIENEPAYWKELENKYNPDGSYLRAYLARKGNIAFTTEENPTDCKDGECNEKKENE